MTFVISRYIRDVSKFKRKIRLWAEKFEHVCYLDSNDFVEDKYSSYEMLLGVVSNEKKNILEAINDENIWSNLLKFQKNNWLFGVLSYDLKNYDENLVSNNLDLLGLPNYYFFKPIFVFELNKNGLLTISTKKSKNSLFKVWQEIDSTLEPQKPSEVYFGKPIELVNPHTYLQKINQIKEHIVKGNIYELNFCHQFYWELIGFQNGIDLFEKLNNTAQSPFSAWLKSPNFDIFCSSPERYLKKNGNKLISQPIKGTISRSENLKIDQKNRKTLKQSPKDRSENVMIVDLVRNDLSRVCQAGTVNVEELYGVYGFARVYHLISTISGQMKVEKNWLDAIRASFPMGSMTGAPKISAMKIIDTLEASKRGFYSGAIGYIKPNTDFDFNVVIRSLIYSKITDRLSYHVGGAIIEASNPQSELSETYLKAKNIISATQTF